MPKKLKKKVKRHTAWLKDIDNTLIAILEHLNVHQATDEHGHVIVKSND